MDNRVRKDYNLLVSTGENYERDAVFVSYFLSETAPEKLNGLIATFGI